MSQSIFDMLSSQLGDEQLELISRKLGADRTTTAKAVPAALGTLMAGLARNTTRGDGAASLAAALQRDHDGSILDDLPGLVSAPERGKGAGILGHVFGRRQEAVQSALGQSTGLDAGSMGQLMTMLAPLVLGALGRTQRQQGLDAGGLAGLLDKEKRSAGSRAPELGGMLGGLLDADGDGDTDLGDALKLAGKFFGKRR